MTDFAKKLGKGWLWAKVFNGLLLYGNQYSGDATETQAIRSGGNS